MSLATLGDLCLRSPQKLKILGDPIERLYCATSSLWNSSGITLKVPFNALRNPETYKTLEILKCQDSSPNVGENRRLVKYCAYFIRTSIFKLNIRPVR